MLYFRCLECETDFEEWEGDTCPNCGSNDFEDITLNKCIECGLELECNPNDVCPECFGSLEEI